MGIAWHARSPNPFSVALKQLRLGTSLLTLECKPTKPIRLHGSAGHLRGNYLPPFASRKRFSSATWRPTRCDCSIRLALRQFAILVQHVHVHKMPVFLRLLTPRE